MPPSNPINGCRVAISAAQTYRQAEADCAPLAYGLHLTGGRCRRLGGPRQCGTCAGDVLPLPALTFETNSVQVQAGEL